MQLRHSLRRTRAGRSRLVAAFTMVALLLLTGCSSVYMKGTPLYTGEFSKPQGPPEDRVNLWPVAYYHDPALSVLWPLGEWTDDHAAMRPLFSVYKLDKTEHKYNVLWPLTAFDNDADRYHVFPFFWGGENEFKYAAMFPIVWYGRDEYFAVFPLWIRRNIKGGHATDVLWPFFHMSDAGDKQSLWFWPLAGMRMDPKVRYRWMLWPLCHDYWHRKQDRHVRTIAPLYFSDRGPKEGWDTVLPLFWHSYGDSKSLTLSPIYSSGREGEDAWQLMFPLFFRNRSGDTSQWVTPLIGRSRSKDRSTWAFVPTVSWFTTEDSERDLWLLGPMSHFNWGGVTRKSHVLPLYFYDGDKDRFLSLPFSRSKPSATESDLWFFGPLARWRTGGEHKSHVAPLYHFDGEEDVFLSPLFSVCPNEHDGFFNLVGPLFTYRWQAGGHWSWHALWPFISGYNEPSRSGFHAWPLYGRERGERTLPRPPSSKAEGPVRLPTETYRKGFVAWPICTYRFSPNRSQFSLFPLASYSRSVRRYQIKRKDQTHEGEKRSKSFRSLILFWHRRSEHPKGVLTPEGAAVHLSDFSTGFWPLYSYKGRRHDEQDTAEFHLLGWLYDRKRIESPKTEKKEAEDYRRARVLWRVMHYERDGDHKTLDMFPFITYDREPSSGFRKISFAWRLFRYERGRDGSLKTDVLFIPVWRAK